MLWCSGRASKHEMSRYRTASVSKIILQLSWIERQSAMCEQIFRTNIHILESEVLKASVMRPHYRSMSGLSACKLLAKAQVTLCEIQVALHWHAMAMFALHPETGWRN
ncbi:hypothetical protein BT93_F0857 [Corymbia citriodora subsp. variegata]|nr:hypothetical protein BT93_F0857 [Corymbia citriodora subsp. variegata]